MLRQLSLFTSVTGFVPLAALSVVPTAVAIAGQAPGTTLVSVGVALGQAPGGVAVELSKESGTGQGVEEDAADKAQAFINQKGWSMDKSKDGFLALIGSASIPCLPGIAGDNGMSSFERCRQAAFEQALLQAKAKLAEYLRMEVCTSLESTLTQGNPKKTLAPTPSSAMPPQLLDKAKMLLNFELDRRLKERGIVIGDDEKSQRAARESAAEVLQSNEFKSAIEATARAELSGTQAYRSFETMGKGKGKIAVIAIHSDKSAQLHQALMGEGEAPAAPAGAAMGIRDWARMEGPQVMLYTHGAQPRTSETGEVVLVGFGQASPLTDSGLSEDIAVEQAILEAQGALRRFMGEFIEVNKSATNSISLKELSNANQEFKDTSSFQKKTTAIGAKLGMPGAKEVLQWKSVHPASGKMVYGSVYVWSVSDARKANALFLDFAKAGGASGGAGSFGVKPDEPAKKPLATAPAGKSSKGEGAEGERP